MGDGCGYPMAGRAARVPDEAVQLAGRGSSVESVSAVQGARGWRGYPLLLRERRRLEPAAAPADARMAWIRRRVSRRNRTAHPAVETRRTGGGRVHRDHPVASRVCLLGLAGRYEHLEYDDAEIGRASCRERG